MHSTGVIVLGQASTAVATLVRGPARRARVLLSEPTAVYLAVPRSSRTEIVALLTSDTVRIPLGCLLPYPSDGRLLAATDAPARVGGGGITVGELTVRATSWWDPRPRMPATRPAVLPEGAQELRTAVFGPGPASGMTLPGVPGGPGGPLAALRGAVRRADLDAALRAATRLVGFGDGPVPAGDAVLAGTIAGLVLLGHPAADRMATAVTSLADRRTTELSAALLRQAAAGRVSGRLAAVLRGLVGDGALRPAIGDLVAGDSENGRALALGLYTAIALIQRTMPRD